MSYKEVDDELRQLLKEAGKTIRNSRLLGDELDSISQEIEDLERSVEDRIMSEKDSRFLSHLSSLKTPLTEKRQKLQSELDELVEEYNCDSNSLSVEAVYESDKKEDSTLSSISNVSSDLEKAITDFIGTRFYREFLNQLDDSMEILDPEDLNKTLEDCEQIYSRAKKLGLGPAGKTNPKTLVDTLLSSLEHSKEKVDSKLKYGAIVGLASVLAWLVFPIYLLFLTAQVVQNVRRARIYSKMSLALKLVEINKNEYEDRIRRKAEERFNQLVGKLRFEFTEREKYLKEELRLVDFDLRGINTQAEETFLFDEDSLRQDLLAPLEIQQKQYQTKLEESNNFEQRTKELNKSVAVVKAKLEEEVNLLKDKYLSTKVSDGKILDRVYLTDIVDNKPEFFELSEHSSSFVFLPKENESRVRLFSKHIIFQTRNRLATSSMKFKVWDEHGVGSHYLSFYKDTDKFFQIRTEVDNIKEDLEGLMDDVKKRTEIIKRDFKTITEYNNKMIEIESVPETYVFVLIWNPSASIANSPALKKVLENGADLGVHIILFVDDSKIEEYILELLPSIGKCYNYYDEKISSIAKRPLVERICQSSDLDPEKMLKLVM